ncbi:MAG TPA: aminoacyl-tRNA hydrolase [Solirubrobacteraceae bacterium]
MTGDDPYRMFLVVRKGAFADLARAAELAGAAAVACVRRFEHDPAHAEAFAAWRPRPGKVCLRARTASQWERVLASEPHAGSGIIAIPPRRRSERGPLLERLQAHSADLERPPKDAPRRAGAITYLLNPAAEMTSGKTLAQVAHAAVMAADSGRAEDWVARGCPGRVLAPDADAFAEAARGDLLACVEDAGLTEVAPGTVTVVALA